MWTWNRQTVKCVVAVTVRTASCSVMAVMLGKIIIFFLLNTCTLVCLSNHFPCQTVFYIYLFLDKRSKVEHQCDLF